MKDIRVIGNILTEQKKKQYAYHAFSILNGNYSVSRFNTIVNINSDRGLVHTGAKCDVQIKCVSRF